MALIRCAECGNEISDKASACPRCGAPVGSGVAPAPPPAPATPAPSAPQQATSGLQPPPAKPIKPFLTIGRLILWAFILGGGWLAFKMATGTSLVAAVRGPQVIVNERLQLKEGSAMGYGFTVPSPRQVDVEVSASPKNVDIMLMTEDQWAKYQKVHGSLFGGQFQYTRALSRQGVMTWSGSDVLPAGAWRVVVERPAEAILFGEATTVSVKITGH